MLSTGKQPRSVLAEEISRACSYEWCMRDSISCRNILCLATFTALQYPYASPSWPISIICLEDPSCRSPSRQPQVYSNTILSAIIIFGFPRVIPAYQLIPPYQSILRNSSDFISSPSLLPSIPVQPSNYHGPLETLYPHPLVTVLSSQPLANKASIERIEIKRTHTAVPIPPILSGTPPLPHPQNPLS